MDLRASLLPLFAQYIKLYLDEKELCTLACSSLVQWARYALKFKVYPATVLAKHLHLVDESDL